MPNFEAIADAITGGVLGRAVEPKAGEADGHTHERNCLNCGAELVGDYCHACGQRAHVHRTLTAFWHDLVHGVFHFEGKIWHTLPLLAWKPGELTRRYIDGQRARFVSPIALFLFCVFLTFAVLSLTSHWGGAPEAARKDAAAELKKDQVKLDALQTQRAQLANSSAPAAALDEKIADLKTEMTALQAIEDKSLPVANMDVTDSGGVPDWIVEAIGQAKENPELVIYKIKTNAYKFSWALIPISVPFVWMLFPFSRRFRLYDHTVFVTYSLSFMMLLLVAATLVGLVAEPIASLAWFVPPVHMYRQLKGTYDLGRWGAIWRAAALTIFAFIAISLFTSLLVGLGAFG
jgi:cell division protein FtsB